MSFMSKVTALVTRPTSGGVELLLLEHPYAGVQLPGGTVNVGEDPQQAVLREVQEETGLSQVKVKTLIGCMEWQLKGQQYYVIRSTRVYARPDTSSFDWAELHRGLMVNLERRQGDFAQVTYLEHDSLTDPRYVTYQITGWVPVSTLSKTVKRYFFHLIAAGETPERWQQYSDRHYFKLFWASVDRLPRLVEPHQQWLDYVLREKQYSLS